MIEVLEGFPANVVAFSAKGRVTRGDYEAVLIPKVKAALAAPGNIRCYYELGAGFSAMEPGAAWEDFRIGMESLARWERIALVTDVEWIRLSMTFFRFMIPGEVRVFALQEANAARLWIAE